MRFHIGFSKFIRPSLFIRYLGYALIGLLAFLGFNKYANADSVVSNFDLTNYIDNSGGFSYYNNNNGTITNGFNNVLPIIAYCSQSANRNSSYCRSYQQSPYNNYYPITANYDNVFYPLLSVRNGSYNINSFKESYFYVEHSFCNFEDNNSIDIWFDYRSDKISYYNNMLSNSKFNNHFGTLTTLSDMYYFGIDPVYQEPGPTQRWSCNIQYDSVNENGSYIIDRVYCKGIPIGSIDNPVIGYRIYLGNKYAYNLEPQQLVYTGTGTQDIYPSFDLKRTIDYQCLYEESSNPDTPLFPNDGRGSSNINFSEIDNTYESEVPAGVIDTSIFNIPYPNTFTQFLEFPLYLASAVVNNRGQCEPLQINFSSFTQRFGGFNYVLELPCLSSSIQTWFSAKIVNNITLYNLIDMFIAFYLLYLLATRVVVVIDMMMTGQDMTGYLFSGTSDDTWHDNEVISVGKNGINDTHYYKKGKRRY